MANGSGFQKDGGATGDDVLQPALAALRSQRPNDAERIATDLLKRQPRHDSFWRRRDVLERSDVWLRSVSPS